MPKIAGESIKLVYSATHDTDWSFGYTADGSPVMVNEDEQGYALVLEGCKILNRGEGYVWYAPDNKWISSHVSNYPNGKPGNLTNPDDLDWEWQQD